MNRQLAIVFDQLIGAAGSERIAQYVCEEFPDADVYTLAYNPKTTLEYFARRPITTTWMNRFAQSPTLYRLSFPLSTRVMSQLDLSSYEQVLSCSATVAKYVRTRPGSHICYCYIPTRALWHSQAYFQSRARTYLLAPLLRYLRNRDYEAAQHVDHYIAISDMSRMYINEYYGREAQVIPCPIDLARFRPSGTKQDHYLIVSRMEKWKRLDYAIEAFNRTGLPLKVVGTGSEEARLRRIAKQNITFLGSIDDESLAREYSEAKAVVFTPFLEYGLIPLEANACGTPVLCFGKGGVLETMVSLEQSQRNGIAPTAVFFFDQTPEALIEAIQRFELQEFDSSALVHHAMAWSIPEFKRKLRTSLMERSVLQAAVC